MKTNRIGKSLLATGAAALMLQLGLAQAEEQPASGKDSETRIVKTRSADDCYADLMRDWTHRSSGKTGVVNFRSSAEAHADLVRDWNGPDEIGVRPSAHSRTTKAAYDDLVRNWGG